MTFGPTLHAHQEIGKLFETDASLAERYYAVLRKSHHGHPERRLMAAILEDVVACLTVDPRHASSRQRRDYRDAKNWLNAADAGDWIFSFCSICEALGIDPSYLRAGLNRWIATRGDRTSQTLRALPNLAGMRHKLVRLRA